MFLRAANTASLRLRLLRLLRLLRHRLAHEGELALLRLEAKGEEVLDGLLARRRLTTGNDAALLKDKIGLLETARGLTSRAMEDLCFGANARNGRHVSICRRDYLAHLCPNRFPQTKIEKDEHRHTKTATRQRQDSDKTATRQDGRRIEPHGRLQRHGL